MSIDSSFRFLPIPTEIEFGCGIFSTLPERIRGLGCKKALVVTDRGMRAAGAVARVEALLSAPGIGFDVYDSVTPDSGSNLIMEAAGLLKHTGADVVIGLGGGSALDTSKAVAAMATNPGTILDYTGLDKLIHKPLPVVAIPTASGTGSEVTFWAVFIDDRTNLKVAAGGVLLFPTIALCDPELTLTLPPSATATTGMDTLRRRPARGAHPRRSGRGRQEPARHGQPAAGAASSWAARPSKHVSPPVRPAASTGILL